MVSQADTPLALQASDATEATHAYAGDELYVLVGFDLAVGVRGRGLTVRVEGPVDELTSARVGMRRPTDEVKDADAQTRVRLGCEDGALVAVLDHVQLGSSEAVDSFRVSLTARTPHEGTFRFRVTVATTADGAELRASCDLVVNVLPMPRLPVLPTWVEHDWLLTVRDALALHDGRETLEGWLALHRPWKEIGEIVTNLVVELAGALAGSSSGDGSSWRAELDPYGRSWHYEDVAITRVPAPGTSWFDLLEALAKARGRGTHGVHVVLHSDATTPATRIDIWHRYDGWKFSGWCDVACPEVELVWSCPRPVTDAAARALGRLGADVLARAGDVAGNLGGATKPRRQRTSRVAFGAPATASSFPRQ